MRPTLDTVRMISNSEAERKLTSCNFESDLSLLITIDNEPFKSVRLAPGVNGKFCFDATWSIIRHPVCCKFRQGFVALDLASFRWISLDGTPRGP